MSGTGTFAEVDAAEAIRRQSGGAVLVDVREDDEWAAGHAPDALHLPLGTLPAEISQLQGKTVLTVCRSGARSARAAEALRGAGVDVTNVAGGMSEWSASGLPVVRDDGSPGTVV